MKEREGSPEQKQAEIDWESIDGWLEKVRAGLEDGRRSAPEERRRILRDRAKVLARKPEREASDKVYIEVVEFGLAQERYAVESAFVREVYPLKELTPLPCTPPFVLGIVNVRGQILSVVDLKVFFDLPEEELTDLNRVIVLHSENMEFGMLADAILDTRRVLLSQVQASLPTLTDIREDYLKGVTEERTVILDAEKLLADPRMVVHEEAEV